LFWRWKSKPGCLLLDACCALNLHASGQMGRRPPHLTFPRHAPEGIPDASAAPILSSMSRLRISTPHFAASRSAGCRWGRHHHRRGLGASASGVAGMHQGHFRGWCSRR
jgi:hypothetical protein